MNSTEPTLKESVHTAAAVLDKTIPGWHNRVNLKQLKMSDCTQCMLGQTFGLEAEMSIAKELHPKLWNKAKADLLEGGWYYGDDDSDISGYDIGIQYFQNMLEAEKISSHEYEAIDDACRGSSALKCLWANEIADRQAKDQDEKRLPSEGSRS